MKWTLAFISVFWFTNFVEAAPVSQAPLHRVQRNCLDYDFSKISCRATPATEDLYQNAETFQNRFRHMAARVLLRILVWDLPPQGGPQLVNQIHSQIKNYANRNRLSTCQRAALATCTVNQILEYDDTLNDPESFWDRLFVGLLSPNYFYYTSDSKGICTEFCSVYAQVGRVLGLQVNELANGIHCFNRVRSGNSWLYVEPQEGGRRPYYLNNNTFYLLDIR